MELLVASSALALALFLVVHGVAWGRGVRRRQANLDRRVQALTAQVSAIAEGATPDFAVPSTSDGFAHLERAVVALTDHTRVRRAELQEESERQKLDTQVQRALAMAETEDAALEIASRAFAEAAPACPSELLLGNESESELHLAAVAPSGAPGCPVASPAGCAAMRAGQTLRFWDPDALDVCPHLRNRRGGAKRSVCVPLAPTRGTSGVLHVTAENGPLPEERIARLELVASHVGTRLRMLHVLQEFQNQAETDALTGLLNRRSFEERTTPMLRTNRQLTLAIVDLDHFKRLNDTHGHAVGDYALRVFARTARTFARGASGMAARLGGEEFVIVLPTSRDVSPEVQFDALRDALREALSSGACPPFSVSVGVANFPAHGTTLSELLSAADRALYVAKSRGRDRVVVHGVKEREPAEVQELPPRRGSIRPADVVGADDKAKFRGVA